MFDFNTNLKALVWTMFLIFLGLTGIVAIFPSFQMQNNYGPLPGQMDLNPDQRRGLEIYVAENCAACHTQQVRNIEMDAMWGKRPAIPQDYYYSKKRLDVWRQSPSLLGSERTGPDLTSIGSRQPSDAWHLLHLYEPRAVVPESIMPSYRWLFHEVDSNFVRSSDVVIKGIPDKYIKDPSKKVVATNEALALVEYLKFLKQPEMPEGMEVPEFIPLREKDRAMVGGDTGGAASGPNGKNLYESTCAVCHQSNGGGIPGAFPPLDGSGIANNPDASTMIRIVIEGYDGNPDYAPMPPFGSELTDEEIAAILTYERSSWGNNAPAVTADEVKAVRDGL